MRSRSRPLPSKTLVAEAVDHSRLRVVLAHGGYVAGAEREFFGRNAEFEHVTEQVLLFERRTGAGEYLRWLRSHAADSLGEARSVVALDIGAGGFRFRPRGCGCHSETPTYLVAWRDGPIVLTVLASGPGATPAAVGGLARKLDRAAQGAPRGVGSTIAALLDSPRAEESNRSTRTQVRRTA